MLTTVLLQFFPTYVKLALVDTGAALLLVRFGDYKSAFGMLSRFANWSGWCLHRR